MKTSNYLLFLAIYGGITATMMLFNPSGSLKDYGINADSYHKVIFQYLGIANMATAAIAFFLRNENQKVVNVILLVSAIEMILSSLKGFYDVQISGVTGNTFFWADALFRLVVGLVSVFVYFKSSKNSI